ncbi:MAG: bifunctional UDP-N-acetylglucosamine diphosphorylase/glucosamine-1-phosphate N-acetyltransferase GlmU, partial [Pseudomonadota bacterium]
GTRMRSALPKILHPLAHKPLVQHVLDTAKSLLPDKLCLVYGHGGEEVKAAIHEPTLEWVEQAERLGTGHAVAQAMPMVPDEHMVLVMYGDVPLIQPDTLRNLLDAAGEDIGLLTMEPDSPSGYGRIVRDAKGKVLGIVEEKDADEDIKPIREVNTGILCVPAGLLRDWLSRLKNDNAQGEYYLTDIIGLAAAEGKTVHTASADDIHEVLGVNDRVQLATLERHYQSLQAETLMRAGITLRDPARLDVRGEIETGQDVVIDVNVVLEGKVKLGHRVTIESNVIIRDADIGDDVEIRANSVIDNAVVGKQCIIGPFARLRPESNIGEDVHIGNFVEIKKSNLGDNVKINHLAYAGDTDIGRDSNIGAGVITCNYDGVSKHKTIIGEGAFIGSNVALVAPVEVGDNATIGAGSTISKNAPADALSLTRAPQKSLKGWRRRFTGKE